MALLGLAACTPQELPAAVETPEEPVIPSELEITEGNIALDLHESVRLTVSTTEGTDSPGAVSWLSRDESVAGVDKEGSVYGMNNGMTWIVAQYGTAKDSCRVTVGDLVIAQVDNLIKILPGDMPEHKPETLRVARGETATLQLALTAFKDVASVKAALHDFSGALMPEVSIGWLRYVKSSPAWHGWAGGAPADELMAEGDMYPDPIMPADEWNLSLKAGENAVLWAEFGFGREYPAGTYKCSIRFETPDKAHTIPFVIEVYNAVLPQKQSLTVVQWETGTYDAMNNGLAVEVGSDRYFELQGAVVRQVSEYGQNGFRLNDAIVPSKMGAWYNFDGNSLVIDPETGKPEFNFNFWDYLEPYIENYLANCPDVHHIHAPGFVSLDDKGRLKGAINYYAGNNWPDGKGAYPEDQDAIDFCKAYFSKLEKHLKSRTLPDGRTWFDIYHQSIFDEPIDARAADWNAWARLIKAGSPEMKIVEATSTDKLDSDLCDVLCPLLDKLSTTVAKEGQTQWFYTGMAPQGAYANRLVRMPLIKTRVLHWINYKYDAKGFLHWGLMYWMGVSDPYKEIQGSGFPGGDLFIIYPGNGKSYPSIRLAAMRDGIHDYELLRLVAEKSEADADAFADRIVQGYSSYNTDVENFRAVRKEMLEYLSR